MLLRNVRDGKEANVLNKGQTYIFSISALFVLVLFLIFVLYTGSLVRERIQLQNASDSSALSGAVWEARGLNLLSALNTGMTIAVAVIVFETAVFLALSAICFLTFWAGGGSCSFIPSWVSFMRKTIPSLWKSAKEMESIGDKVVRVFPAFAVADALRIAYLNPGVRLGVVYPFIPGDYRSEEGKLTLHVRKGSFGEIVNHIERIVSVVIEKAVSEGLGDEAGSIAGRAVGAVAGFIGRYTGKALSGLKHTGEISVKSEERKVLTRRECREVWELVKEVVHMDEWGYAQRVSLRGVEPYMWGVERKSEGILHRERRYELTFTYRHYQYLLVDKDRDGNGIEKDGDGCVRKWAHFENHVPGNPFLAKEYSDELWGYMGETPNSSSREDYCDALSRERKEVCDGQEYIVEKWEFRKVDVKIEVMEKTEPPDEPPNPFVLMEDAPRNLWLSSAVKGERTFAVSQARAFSPSAVPGRAFFSMDWDVSLMRPTVFNELKEIMR